MKIHWFFCSFFSRSVAITPSRFAFSPSLSLCLFSNAHTYTLMKRDDRWHTHTHTITNIYTHTHTQRNRLSPLTHRRICMLRLEYNTHHKILKTDILRPYCFFSDQNSYRLTSFFLIFISVPKFKPFSKSKFLSILRAKNRTTFVFHVWFLCYLKERKQKKNISTKKNSVQSTNQFSPVQIIQNIKINHQNWQNQLLGSHTDEIKIDKIHKIQINICIHRRHFLFVSVIVIGFNQFLAIQLLSSHINSLFLCSVCIYVFIFVCVNQTKSFSYPFESIIMTLRENEKLNGEKKRNNLNILMKMKFTDTFSARQKLIWLTKIA